MTLCSAVLLLAFHADLPPWAPGGPSSGEDLSVSLAIIGPGDDLASMGGHAALVVVDKKREQGRLYNFGVVDFSSDLMWNFVAGKLDFFADEASIMQTYDAYRALDRDIRVLELNLTYEQRLQMANALAVGVLPANRTIRYHHFDDNCSTRPRDVIDRALGGALSRETSGRAAMSLREHARRYTQVHPVVAFWLDYMQNDSIDRPITRYAEGFLPDELGRQLKALEVDGKPVVKQTTTLYQTKNNPSPSSAPVSWNVELCIASLVLGGVVIALAKSSKRWARKALGALLAFEGLAWGTSGLLLFLLATLSQQQVMYWNENLLFVNPVTFALLPLGVMLFKENPHAEAALKWVTLALAVGALVGAAIKVLPAADQGNSMVIALVVPLSLMSAVAFRLSRT